MELVVTMDIALLIPPAGRSAAQPSSSALSETGQFQQLTQSGAFSALLKDAVKNTDDEQTPPLSDTDGPIESAPSTAADDYATGAALIGIAVASFSQVPDIHEVASPAVDKAEFLSNSSGFNLQSSESIPLLPQGLTVVAPHDNGALSQEPAPADPPQPRTTDSSISSSPQPLVNSDESGEAPAMTPKQTASGAQDEQPIRNGRGALVDLTSVPLERPSGNSALPGTPLPGSLVSDEGPSPVMENQGRTNLFPAAYMNGGVQFLDRSSTEIWPSAIIQEQGVQETTLLGQALSVREIGDSGGGEQDPFGADAQGAGVGSFFHSVESGAPESVLRGNQSPLFNDQFTSARQTQASPQGTGSSVVTPAAEHLKLTQAFLGEDHSAAMTSARGIIQTVQMELSSHDSGPLSVRISMTDQTVHTQFTTDRSDLGAILIGRQDQLQQNLTKSGLELGQFQVHIDQKGQQEAFPDRQSRRNGGAPEQQLASQDHNQQAQDRERPNHRPMRALSLFA